MPGYSRCQWQHRYLGRRKFNRRQDGVPAGTFMQPNDITGVNPLLAPTNAGQGGFPVVTHPLQAGSPARNGGLNANAVDPLTNLPLTTDTTRRGISAHRRHDG